MVDRGASVHHDVQARIARPSGCGGVDHSKLHPDRLCTELDRFIDVLSGEFRTPEDIDDLELLCGDRRQLWKAVEIADALLVGIDGNDLETLAEEVGGHAEAGTGRVRRTSDDGEATVRGEDLSRGLEVVVQRLRPAAAQRRFSRGGSFILVSPASIVALLS